VRRHFYVGIACFMTAIVGGSGSVDVRHGCSSAAARELVEAGRLGADVVGHKQKDVGLRCGTADAAAERPQHNRHEGEASPR
jgi:hypothetical protein